MFAYDFIISVESGKDLGKHGTEEAKPDYNNALSGSQHNEIGTKKKSSKHGSSTSKKQSIKSDQNESVQGSTKESESSKDIQKPSKRSKRSVNVESGENTEERKLDAQNATKSDQVTTGSQNTAEGGHKRKSSKRNSKTSSEQNDKTSQNDLLKGNIQSDNTEGIQQISQKVENTVGENLNKTTIELDKRKNSKQTTQLTTEEPHKSLPSDTFKSGNVAENEQSSNDQQLLNKMLKQSDADAINTVNNQDKSRKDSKLPSGTENDKVVVQTDKKASNAAGIDNSARKSSKTVPQTDGKLADKKSQKSNLASIVGNDGMDKKDEKLESKQNTVGKSNVHSSVVELQEDKIVSHTKDSKDHKTSNDRKSSTQNAMPKSQPNSQGQGTTEVTKSSSRKSTKGMTAEAVPTTRRSLKDGSKPLQSGLRDANNVPSSNLNQPAIAVPIQMRQDVE